LERNCRRRKTLFNKEGARFSGFLMKLLAKKPYETEPESQQAKPISFSFSIPGNQSKISKI